MKKLLYIITGLLLLAGCKDKVDKSKPAGPQKYPIFRNDFRAAEVRGHNQHWGDFRLLFKYSGDQLETVWRVDAQADTVGTIRISRSDEWSLNVYYVDDWIPAISQDSIERMDAAYKEKYGAGNYSLKDSIPRNTRTILQCRDTYYSDTRVYQQEFMYYRPREDVGITGVNFDNSYIQTRKLKYMYEYSDDGRIAIARWGEYTYTDEKNLNVFDTRQGKYEVTYNNGAVAAVDSYLLPEGSNYVEEYRYQMSYDHSRLSGVTADGYNKGFAYSGDELTVTDNGKVWKYRFDENGNPIRIDNPNGSYMEIRYERGHGDFQMLTPFFDRIMGSPYIK